jgi:uncharacterized protein (TIGR03089 family)
MPTAEVAVLLGREPATTRERPVLVYRDDATGERTELSATELGGWAARTAALLVDGCGTGKGARAAVLLPPHWQTAAVLLGAWSAGVAVEFRPWATAGIAPALPGLLDAAFVSRARLDSWLEAVPAARHRFVLGLGPVAAPPPDGYRDYLAEVARYPDTPPAYRSIGRDDTASPDGTSYREWADIAQGIADSLGLRAGDRLLVDAGRHEQPVAWLLAPLVVGASVVLCANIGRDHGRGDPDPDALDAVAREENATHIL